jgi:hypothetical protein
MVEGRHMARTGGTGEGETTRLKEKLSLFGVSAFVAHEGILATKAWQQEIENALHRMDAFAAI